jgi:nucleoside-diphosphate-sugar epimerase
LSLYAETKVKVEEYLMRHAEGVDWLITRLSTVYGSSPRMRFDLTVNDFTLSAFRDGNLSIFLPESFRPYVHVRDVARVVWELLERFESVKNGVYNLGFEQANYRKIEIAEIVRSHVPSLEIEIAKEGGDPRDYRVDFSKLKNALGLRAEHDVDSAVREILALLRSGIVSDFDKPWYYDTSPNVKSCPL